MEGREDSEEEEAEGGTLPVSAAGAAAEWRDQGWGTSEAVEEEGLLLCLSSGRRGEEAGPRRAAAPCRGEGRGR